METFKFISSIIIFFLKIASLLKIKILALRQIYATLGSKGLKSFQATYPTSNGKSLVYDTANELELHAQVRHAAEVKQLSNGTNADESV